jgi:hypothetical protein
MSVEPNILDFGARLDGVWDDGPALQAFIRSASANAPATSKFRGPRMRLPTARIRIGTPVEGDRAGVLLGAGGAQTYAGTELVVDPDLPYAIRVSPNSATGSGEGLVLRDFKMTSRARSTNGTEQIAILANNRFRLSNVSIGSRNNPFDVAVDVRGNHADTPPSNSNCWLIDRMSSIGNKTAIRTSGADSNAGIAFAVAATGPSGGTSWLFDDDSFLGNLYLGCHASGAGAPGGGFRNGVTSANNRSAYVGCYTEGGTTNAFNPRALVLGGTMGLDAGGFSWVSGIMNRLQIGEAWGAAAFSAYRRIMDPKSFLERYSHKTSATSSTGAPIEYEFRKSDGREGLIGWWLHRWLGSIPNYAIPYMWSDADALHAPELAALVDKLGADPALKVLGAGHFAMPAGFWIGREPTGAPKASRRRVYRTSGPTCPTEASNYGVKAWLVGWDVENIAPVPGGWKGWTCVADGIFGTSQPPKFRGYGLIEA